MADTAAGSAGGAPAPAPAPTTNSNNILPGQPPSAAAPRGGNRNANNNNGGNRDRDNRKDKEPKFTGEIPELKDAVFILDDSRDAAIMCHDALEKIGRYMETKHKSHLIRREIETGLKQQVAKPTMTQVPDPNNAGQTMNSTDDVDKMIFKEELSQYVKQKAKLEEDR